MFSTVWAVSSNMFHHPSLGKIKKYSYVYLHVFDEDFYCLIFLGVAICTVHPHDSTIFYLTLEWRDELATGQKQDDPGIVLLNHSCRLIALQASGLVVEEVYGMIDYCGSNMIISLWFMTFMVKQDDLQLQLIFSRNHPGYLMVPVAQPCLHAHSCHGKDFRCSPVKISG